MLHYKKKLKAILQVTPEYPPYNLGGGGVLFRNLINGLAKRGLNVAIISGFYPVSGFWDHPFLSFDEKVPITWFPLLPSIKIDFQLKTILPPNLFSFLRLFRVFSENNFDIVHIHGFGHLFCDLSSILCRLSLVLSIFVSRSLAYCFSRLSRPPISS